MTDAQSPLDRSYRALLSVPSLGRILIAMQIARIAGSMVGVALVLFTLIEYDSPQLAGLVTFASIFPGLLVSPIAGALLDRHGRVRLIMLDYAVELIALALIAILAAAHLLPPILLLVIAAVASLTGLLSHTGLRSLFPLVVPRHLWERVNAIDSNGYVVATILGPPIAAGLVGVAGGPVAIVGVAAAFGLAAVAMIGIPDPENATASTGRLLVDAWQGVVYTWRNRTLRGLGFTVAVLNLSTGMTTIVVPLIVLDRFRAGEPVVGLMFAVSGLAGMVSTLIFGRFDSRGREWAMLVVPVVAMAPTIALLLPASAGGFGSTPDALQGLLILGFAMTLVGLLAGPFDIALFTVRQRRTDPAWMGRAFAVSMAFNFVGFPTGAAIAGTLAASSLESAIVVGIVACGAAAVIAALMIPTSAEPLPGEIVPASMAADGRR